jgi:hypothetical protein
MTEAGEKRLVELCEEEGARWSYMDLMVRRWWCISEPPRGLLARLPIRELEFDKTVVCAKCGRPLNHDDWAFTEVF